MFGSQQIKLTGKIAIRKVGNTYVIVTLDNVMHKIDDPVGVFILDLLVENKRDWSMDDIWTRIAESFDVSKDPDYAQKTVEKFLNSLVRKGILNGF